MDIVIREANIKDEEKIFKLVKAFATSFKAERVFFSESLKHILNDNSALLLLAEANKEVIGYCLAFDHYAFYANGRVSWLEEIMVDESFRRMGIGKQLMIKFEEWSRLRNSKVAALATRRASLFYSAIGYEESATFFRKIL